MLLQFLVNGFATGCQIAIFALAFWLLYAAARFIDVSQAGLFVVGGYAYLTLAQAGVPAGLAVGGSVAAGVAVGAASDLVIFRPLARRSASMPVLLLTSLALYEVFVNLAAIAFGNSTRMLSSAVPQAWTLGPVVVSQSQALQVLAAVGVTTFWVWVTGPRRCRESLPRRRRRVPVQTHCPGSETRGRAAARSWPTMFEEACPKKNGPVTTRR